MKEKKYACQCCGYLTLDMEPPGTFSICPICFWQDDYLGDPDEISGANGVSFREAQENYKELGASKKRSLHHVSKPTEDDVYKGALDVSEIKRMPIAEMVRIFKACDMPLEKIFHLYISKYPVKNSKYIFSSEELEKYITSTDIVHYMMLESYHNFKSRQSQGLLYEKELIGLTDEQVEEKKRTIIEKFIKNAEADILK